MNKVVVSVKEILSRDLSQTEKAMRFFEEIIIEMVEPIQHTSISSCKKIAIKFRDEGLGDIFSYCISMLLQYSAVFPVVKSQILKIVNLCLSFDFSDISSDDPNSDPHSLQILLSWKVHFENQEILVVLGNLVETSFGEEEYIAIRVINQMGAIRKTIFQGAEERNRYILYYCTMLSNIMNRKTLVGNSLFEFLQAIRRFFCNFVVKEIAAAVNFGSFLDQFANFSINLLRIPQTLFNTDYNSMSIWSYLSYEGRNQSDLISNYIPTIFNAFLENSILYISQENFSAEEENETKSLLITAGIFSIYYYPEVYHLVEKCLNQEIGFLKSGVTREFQLSWLIYICSSLLTTENKKTGTELNESIVESIISLISTVNHSIPCIKLSIISFFQAFTKTYLCCSMDNCWGDGESMIGLLSVGQISDMLIEFLLSNLSIYTKGKILEETISLLEKVCLGYYSSKVLLGLPKTRSLLSYPDCLFSDRKLRRRLFTILSQLWAGEEFASINFYEKLISKVRAPNKSLEDLKVIFTEMHGIFRSIGTSQHYLELFELIHSDLWDITSNYENFASDPDTVLTLLQFFKELTDNRNSRIQFKLCDVHGVVIFRNIAQVLVFYDSLDRSSASTDDKILVKKRRLSLDIVNNMISGGYISFGVFEVYQDKIFTQALSISFDICNSFEINEKV